MSSSIKNKDRMERSCHLTLKQYNIILSYLNTGIKPAFRTLEDAGLVGNLNGGVNKSGKYHRLKSIASRLSLRPTDGALVFTSNGKVVIPASKFVQTIRQAHKGTGDKHLNVSQTTTKLQETYTIGRRQFGMCEDQIRDVVKSCNQGSCRTSRKRKRTRDYAACTPAKKAGIEKSDTTSQAPTGQGCQLLKSLLAVKVYQPPGQTSGNLQQTLSQSATQLDNVPARLSTSNCLLVLNSNRTPTQSSSLTDLQSFANPSKSVGSNILLISPLSVSGSGQSSGIYTLPTTLINRNLNQVQVASNVQSQSGSNVLLFQNLTGSIGPKSGVNLVYTPAINIQSALTPSNESSSNVSSLLEVNSFINSFASSVDENNNVVSRECSASSLLEPDKDSGNEVSMISDIYGSDLDHSRYTDLDLSGHNGPGVASDDEDLNASESRDDSAAIEDKDPPTEDEVPFPHIWHYYQDFSGEKNPYQKMYIGIQDMKLDLMKSLIGDTIAAERLKKKIAYLDQLVKKQRIATEPFKLDLNLSNS